VNVWHDVVWSIWNSRNDLIFTRETTELFSNIYTIFVIQTKQKSQILSLGNICRVFGMQFLSIL